MADVDRPSSGTAVDIVVVVPSRLGMVHNWLRCKFGISSHEGDRTTVTHKDGKISISIFDETSTLDPQVGV